LDITQILAFSKEHQASDVLLIAGNPPVVRVDGALKKLKGDSLTNQDIKSIIYAVMDDQQRTILEQALEIDFAVSFGEKSRFRVNAFYNRSGLGAVFRVVPMDIPSFEDLDLPPIFEKICEKKGGLVIVSGASGAGKSTTMACMLNHINETQAKHILTIEDPVEFIHQPQKSLVTQREIGQDTESYEKAVRSALFEDVNVLYLGQINDYKTAKLALQAAEAGILVFATIHAASSTKAVNRLIDSFPVEEKEMTRQLLSSVLEAVICQQLLPKKSGQGRMAAFEILIGTNAVKNLIKDGKTMQLQSVMQTSARFGMISMDLAVSDLEKYGVVETSSEKEIFAQAS
tara:strand:+ start:671 stop:1702 length:1032 start_codon:yes stop_codon:yes gene_type:complete